MIREDKAAKSERDEFPWLDCIVSMVVPWSMINV